MTDERQNVTTKPWGVIVHTDAGDIPVVKDRLLYVQDEDFSLSPDSLVGSHFHVIVEGELIWQGAVVGEPQPGKYLCQVSKLEEGALNVQRIFSCDTLMGLGEEGRRIIEGAIAEVKAPVVAPSIEWRLYDSQAHADRAYVAWLESRPVTREEAS